MRRRKERSRILKNISNPRGGNRARKRPLTQQDRNRFQDEARVGQKNKITRRWAKRGSRPSAPKDQRTASTYIFWRHSPKGRQGRGPCPARLQHLAMNLHLADRQERCSRRARSPARRSGRLAYDRVGRARQHHHNALAAQMPGTQPDRNVWQFIRDNWLSNRVFKSYDDIIDHCCDAWNKPSTNHGALCPSDCEIGRRVLISEGCISPGYVHHVSAFRRMENCERAERGPRQHHGARSLMDWPANPKDGMSHGRVLCQGATGWTCMPDVPGRPRRDPMCADETMMKWLAATLAGRSLTSIS